jgi:hypothetical protein
MLNRERSGRITGRLSFLERHGQELAISRVI